MMLSVDSEQGIIKVGSPPKKLPGILESIEVGGALKMKETSMQGQSGKQKEVDGWNDADVSIKLTLIDDPGNKKTRFDYLKVIVGIFKKMDKNGKPEVFTVTHPFINAWGVKQLILSDLKTSESRGRNKISVSLEFVEYKIIAALAQERTAAAASATAKKKVETQQESAVSTVAARRLSAMEKKLGYI